MPMKKERVILIVLVLVGFILIFIDAAFAAPPLDTSAAMGRMNLFMVNVGVVLNNILNDPNLRSFVWAEWSTFTVILLVTALAKYNFGGINTYEIVHPLLLILVTRIMLNHYDMLTSLFWDFSEGIAGGIQKAVVGNSNPFFLVGFVEDVVKAITYRDVKLWDSIAIVFSTFCLMGTIALLSIISFLASTWALYGYALCKIIGWFFVPFIMLQRLSFLFDGWIRLFTGFIIYGIIARANLMLTVLALRTFFGIPGWVVNSQTVIPLDFTGITQLFGMLGFLLISVIGIISTGKFATAVVAGAGGFGQAISTMAYTAVRFMAKAKV